MGIVINIDELPLEKSTISERRLRQLKATSEARERHEKLEEKLRRTGKLPKPIQR